MLKSLPHLAEVFAGQQGVGQTGRTEAAEGREPSLFVWDSGVVPRLDHLKQENRTDVVCGTGLPAWARPRSLPRLSTDLP
ncbi:MAG: hypothetical protein ACRYG8_21475 [Janthinobacterium lividum]